MNFEFLQIKKWNEKQVELLTFLDSDEPVIGEVIRHWIADCIVHFTEVNVPQNIVAHFLTKMEHVSIKGKKIPNQDYLISSTFGEIEEVEKESSIGPFVFVGNGYLINSGNRLTGKSGSRVKMTPVMVAFRVAQNIIDKYQEETRLVPRILINQLDEYAESKGIAVSLRTLQSSFEIKDTQTMLTSLISATELLLGLITELPKNNKLNKKLLKIYSDETLYKKYSINPEVIWSINNARIIRNIDMHVPSGGNETTLYEAVSYAHLLNLLIYSILSSGEVRLSKED